MKSEEIKIKLLELEQELKEHLFENDEKSDKIYKKIEKLKYKLYLRSVDEEAKSLCI